MSDSSASYSFQDYLLLKPVLKKQHHFKQLRALINYQFLITCVGVFVLASVADVVLGVYWLAAICILGVGLFVGNLYLHYKERYLWSTSVSIVFINLLILVHDSWYGSKAGVYLFYFPLFFSIFTTLAFRRNGWFAVQLLFTMVCWLIVEYTDHPLGYSDSFSETTLHSVFVFCMVVALMATNAFVFFIFAQIRNNVVGKEREKLKAVLDSNAQMIMLLDKQGNIEICNKNFFDFYLNEYGYELEIGANYFAYVQPENRDILEQGWKTALTGKDFQNDAEIKVSENYYWVSIHFVPIFDSNQQVKSVSFSVLDISQRKDYEKNLSETNNMLSKLNNELDNFIYRSSHDMRAPLTSVLGLVELIQEEHDQLERDAYVGLIGKSVSKLDQLLVNISQYAKNKKLAVKQQRIDFQSIVDELIEGMRYAKNAQDIDFRVDVQQASAFYCDEERIRSVLGNLISNAIRYRSIGANAFVQVKVIVTAQNAHIEVVDNGIGIAPEYQTRIFDMFFKASDKSVGSGLGLYIVKEMVAAMQGTISVASVQYEGSRFIVDIPNHPLALSPADVPSLAEVH